MTVDKSLKLPPHPIEAEQSVLGALLLSGLANDNQAWDSIANKVAATDFYRQDHQLIYNAIADLVGNEKPIDLVTVSEQLKQSGDLDNAGGLAYLATIVKDTPSAANIKAYAEIVREKSMLRQVITICTEAADIAFSGGKLPAKAIINKVTPVLRRSQMQDNREYKVISAERGYFAIATTWWVEGSPHQVTERTEGAFSKLSLYPIIGFLIEVNPPESKYKEPEVLVHLLGAEGVLGNADYILTPNSLITDVANCGGEVVDYTGAIMEFDSTGEARDFVASLGTLWGANKT